ncbi:Uncharacterised protein [uncultured archaeon]|nr:Uncharacterised protein [uncultured archaeon]
MTLHTFGDSHSHHGWNSLKVTNALSVPIEVHHLGPFLMHTFGNKKTSLIDLNQYNVKPGDAVVFCFGEIDCRCHINKFHDTYEKTIKDLVLRYMEAIAEVVGDRSLRVAVEGVLPTVEISKSQKFNNPDFPFLGSDAQRQTYISRMNMLLKEACSRRGYTFFDVFSEHSTPDGFLVPAPKSDGMVHAGDFTCMIPAIEAFLEKSKYGPIYGKEFDLPEIYQPVFGLEHLHPVGRLSDSRIETILSADRVYNGSALLKSSVCDFGSNLGHFSMSLEAAGCSGKVTGVECGQSWVDASNHIAKSVGSKCTFTRDFVEAEAYLFLSVSHHNMTDSTYSGMQDTFDRVIASGAHTIYVEQATHLEFLPWAAKLRCSGNVYLHFKRELEKVTHGLFSVRLIGVDRNERLNTVRPIYQLKKKVDIELEVDGKKYRAYDTWDISFIGVQHRRPLGAYYYAVGEDGKDYFLKYRKDRGWFPPEPKKDGMLLSDIFRWGMLPFYDMSKMQKEIFFKYTSNPNRYEDFRPWNTLVDEDSNVSFIDTGDHELTYEMRVGNGMVFSEMLTLLSKNPIVKDSQMLTDEFNIEFGPKLGKSHRWEAFSLIAQKLIDAGASVQVVETGSTWTEDWHGQGCSTRVWEWLVANLGGSVKSIDIDPGHVKLARSFSRGAEIIQGDSITELLKMDLSNTSLLFLDSYDHNPPYGLSELHVVGELAVCYERLPSGCLIAVDDCANETSGKHNFVNAFFKRMGIAPLKVSYIYVWQKP